ncbi:MAG: acyltransferase family protein [Marinifilaceae bacterium]
MNKLSENQAERLHGLDHLRTIAILLVMIFHYGRGIPEWLEPVRQIGWTGVDLFFVLSGYLIGFQLFQEIKNTKTIRFKRFYIKRVFRIIPAYVAVLILYYSLPGLREGSGMPPTWKFLTFTQNLGLDAQHHKSFSHAWSLCIEEQFYLLLPILLIAVSYCKLRKGNILFFLVLISLGFVFRIINWHDHVQPFIENGNRREMVYGFLEKIYYPSYNRMDGLLIGVGIAAIFTFKPRLRHYLTKHGNIVLLVGFGVFLIVYKVCDHFISYRTAVYGFPLISIAYGIIVVGAISPGSILYRLESKASMIIATLSYAIYLTHKQIYHLTKLVIEKTGWDNAGTWSFWICIAMAGLGGFILHLIVEKPFLKLRRRILSSEKQKALRYFRLKSLN